MIRIPGQSQIDVDIDLLLLELLLLLLVMLGNKPLLGLRLKLPTLENRRRNLRNKLVLTFTHADAIVSIVVRIVLGLRSEILEIGRNRHCRQVVLFRLRLQVVAWMLIVVRGLVIGSGH